MTGEHNVPNESTGLLPRDDEENTSDLTPGKHNIDYRSAPTPLPKIQLGALIAVRIADPIAYQQIFPYINQFLADLNVTRPDRVGFYSGLVESAYSIAQLFSIYQWGRVSDIIGRRPVVFTGLIGVAVTTLAFGLCSSFAGIVISRFLGGLVSGNVAVIHSILSEITDDTNQDIAVSIYSLAWSVGTAVGPLVGGSLANAATQYPQYFSWNIFIEHPYFPPCLVSATCALAGAGLGYAFIKETLPNRQIDSQGPSLHHSSSSGSRENAGSDGSDSGSIMMLFSVPAIRALTISGFALSFISLAFDVVFTLFCYTPIDAGGLGLDPAAIGNALSFAGVLATLLRVIAMPYILRSFDYAKTYNTCMYIWPIAFGFLPLLNIFVRASSPSNSNSVFVSTSASTSGSGSTSAFVWTGLLVLLALSKIGAIPQSLNMLLIKRHTPSPSALGRSNGLVQFAMCVGRAVGPIVVSTLFTGMNGIGWAKKYGVGWLWALTMVAGSVAGARVTRGIGT